jgi:3-oxoacyl-[acyl-carrier protein] reductase
MAQMAQLELDGRTALVTGGGSGIGAAVSERLSAAGATTIVTDLDGAAATDVATRLGGEALTLDVSDAASVDRCFDALAAGGRPVDVVVHAAGADDGPAKQRLADALEGDEPVALTPQIDDRSWARLVAVNLTGTFNVLRASLRTMCPRRQGAVVVFGSSAAIDAPAGNAHYVASKAGVHGLCASVAKEAICFGVRVNVVAPGPTLTPMALRTPPALRDAVNGDGPVTYQLPDEQADIALFLASPRSSAIAGSVLLANGGRFTR